MPAKVCRYFAGISTGWTFPINAATISVATTIPAPEAIATTAPPHREKIIRREEQHERPHVQARGREIEIRIEPARAARHQHGPHMNREEQRHDRARSRLQPCNDRPAPVPSGPQHAQAARRLQHDARQQHGFDDRLPVHEPRALHEPHMRIDAGQCRQVVRDMHRHEHGKQDTHGAVQPARRDHRARAVSRNVSGVSGLSVMLKTGRGGAIPAGTRTS